MDREGIVVSYLQFVDDTPVIFRGSTNQICILRCVISFFELVSGLKVNLSKSRLFAVGQILNIDIMTEIFGC